MRQAGAEGRITGAVIQTALIGNLERLREEADGMPATIGDAFTLIGNAAMQLVGTWDQVFGASSLVATASCLTMAQATHENGSPLDLRSSSISSSWSSLPRM